MRLFLINIIYGANTLNAQRWKSVFLFLNDSEHCHFAMADRRLEMPQIENGARRRSVRCVNERMSQRLLFAFKRNNVNNVDNGNDDESLIFWAEKWPRTSRRNLFPTALTHSERKRKNHPLNEVAEKSCWSEFFRFLHADIVQRIFRIVFTSFFSAFNVYLICWRSEYVVAGIHTSRIVCSPIIYTVFSPSFDVAFFFDFVHSNFVLFFFLFAQFIWSGQRKIKFCACVRLDRFECLYKPSKPFAPTK